MMIRKTLLLASVLSLLVVSACERDKTPPPKKSKPRSAVSTHQQEVNELGDFLSKSASNSDTNLPPGHPPIEAASEQNKSLLPPGHPPINRQTETGRPLRYDAPEEWASQPVRRPFRQARYLIPRSTVDSEDSQLIVYYFGKGEGGSVELNLERWKGMFTTAEGKPVDEKACRTEVFEANGLRVTSLDVVGHYADAMMSPARSEPTKTVFRMLAAVVETPDGPWFFKAVGPASTLADHRDAFVGMLKSVKH